MQHISNFFMSLSSWGDLYTSPALRKKMRVASLFVFYFIQPTTSELSKVSKDAGGYFLALTQIANHIVQIMITLRKHFWDRLMIFEVIVFYTIDRLRRSICLFWLINIFMRVSFQLTLLFTPTPGGRVVFVGVKVMHSVAPVALLFLRPTKTHK